MTLYNFMSVKCKMLYTRCYLFEYLLVLLKSKFVI